MDKINVLHITESFEGGVVTYLRHILPRQAATGCDVSLVCSPRHRTRQDEELAYFRNHGIETMVCPMRRSIRPLHDLRALTIISRMLRSGRYDVIHTHGFKAGALGRLAARRKQGPVVVHTPHCFSFLRAASFLQGWASLHAERLLARLGHGLIVVSESQRVAAQQYGIRPAGGLTVVPNAIPEDAEPLSKRHSITKRSLGIPDDVMLIGTCGRLVRYKGIERFIEAMSLLKSSDRIVAIIIGDGPCRERLQSKARRYGLEDRVRFLGARDDAAALMQVLDIYVQCSEAEGMPYAILEAMAFGVPVIASEAPGNVDLVTHEMTGLLYTRDTGESLAKSIERCVGDAELRKRIARAAYENVMTHHRVDSQVSSIRKIYTRLINEHGKQESCERLRPSDVVSQ